MSLNDLQRAEILRVARTHGAANERVFGSVARGTSGPSSDLDLLVDFAAGRSLLDQIALQQDLETLLGCPVDIVSSGGLRPHLATRVLAEAVPL